MYREIKVDFKTNDKDTVSANIILDVAVQRDTSCVETCRSSLFVISTIIVTDIYVHSLVELKTIKNAR